MVFRKIAGPMRIDCVGSSYQVYQIPGHPGGRAAKVAQYSIVVLGSSGTSVRIGMDLDHGPNGQVYAPHSAPIVDGNPGSAVPSLLVGDASTSIILNEWLRPSIKIKDGTGNQAQWALIEVYEMLKPF